MSTLYFFQLFHISSKFSQNPDPLWSLRSSLSPSSHPSHIVTFTSTQGHSDHHLTFNATLTQPATDLDLGVTFQGQRSNETWKVKSGAWFRNDNDEDEDEEDENVDRFDGNLMFHERSHKLMSYVSNLRNTL